MAASNGSRALRRDLHALGEFVRGERDAGLRERFEEGGVADGGTAFL